jgi:hypothetical protein
MKQAFDREVAAAECDVPALDGTQTVDRSPCGI